MLGTRRVFSDAYQLHTIPLGNQQSQRLGTARREK